MSRTQPSDQMRLVARKCKNTLQNGLALRHAWQGPENNSSENSFAHTSYFTLIESRVSGNVGLYLTYTLRRLSIHQTVDKSFKVYMEVFLPNLRRTSRCLPPPLANSTKCFLHCRSRA